LNRGEGYVNLCIAFSFKTQKEMSTTPSCFDHIIGLIPAENCLEGYQDEYSESLSGLFLSELQGIKINDTCGLDVFELMLKARRNAILTVKTDITVLSSSNVQPARVPFSGDIGGVTFNRIKNTDGFYGMRLFTSIEGARIKYTGIKFMPYSSGNFVLNVYSDFELLATVPITGCTAKRPKVVTFSTPIVVTQGSTYFIVQGDLTYAGKMQCCGHTSWCFNIDKPCYNSSKPVWQKWVMAAGIHGADVNDRADWRTCVENYGMAVMASFTCNMDELLCSDFSDFENNENDRALAFAILYKTGEYFLNAIIDTGEVNRFTLLGSDALDFNREEYLKRYQQMILWYSDNLDLSRNDCFICKGRSRTINRMGVK